VPIQTVPCKEAGIALACAIVGLFVFGIILGPLAVQYGQKARSKIDADPTLRGSGKATAAVILGVIDIVGAIIAICMFACGSANL
jgi:hypothetical protein